jgi:hypothetical protein
MNRMDCPPAKSPGSWSVPHNTMSTHLAILQRAGLITAERQSRSIVYRASLDSLRTSGDVSRQGLLLGPSRSLRTADRRSRSLLRAKGTGPCLMITSIGNRKTLD